MLEWMSRASQTGQNVTIPICDRRLDIFRLLCMLVIFFTVLCDVYTSFSIAESSTVSNDIFALGAFTVGWFCVR